MKTLWILLVFYWAPLKDAPPQITQVAMQSREACRLAAKDLTPEGNYGLSGICIDTATGEVTR